MELEAVVHNKLMTENSESVCEQMWKIIELISLFSSNQSFNVTHQSFYS